MTIQADPRMTRPRSCAVQLWDEMNSIADGKWAKSGFVIHFAASKKKQINTYLKWRGRQKWGQWTKGSV